MSSSAIAVEASGVSVMPGISSLDCLDKVFRRVTDLSFTFGHQSLMLAFLVIWTETFLTCMHAKICVGCVLCLVAVALQKADCLRTLRAYSFLSAKDVARAFVCKSIGTELEAASTFGKTFWRRTGVSWSQ